MADNKIKRKISYRVSLLWIINLLLMLLFLGFFLQGYLNFKLIKEQNIEINSRAAFLRFLFSDILFFFLVAFCFFVLFKIIIRPIKKLTDLCNEIRKGKLITKPIQSDIQEINDLTTTFNETIGDLKEYKANLEEAKEVLEIKVKARTSELEELAGSLEEKVKERTKELQEKIDELEGFYHLAVGRELKMIALKEEIEKLKKELGKDKAQF